VLSVGLYTWMSDRLQASARLTGERGISRHCGCGPHVIHGVEVSAPLVPQCRPPLLFFLSPVHTSNNVEATLSNATISNVASTLLPFLATMSKQKRQQCRTSFALKFRPFDKVERCFDIVAQNGNIVEATGNKVACCFDNVASTLLLV